MAAQEQNLAHRLILFGLQSALKKIFFLILKAEIVANIEESWISIFFRNLHSHVAYPAGAERGSLQSLACPLPAHLC